MKQFLVTADARADLKGIYRFIALDNRSAATRQIAAFYERFALLGAHPPLGELRPDLGRDLRSFVVGNYVILYRPADAGIEVARVIHAARDIKNLF